MHPRETWTPVKISAQADSPQSFEVVTPSRNRLIRNQQFIRPRDGVNEKRQLSSEPITGSPEAQHPHYDSQTMGESSTAPIQRSSEETNIDQREGATTSAGISPEPSGRPRFSRNRVSEYVKMREYLLMSSGQQFDNYQPNQRYYIQLENIEQASLFRFAFFSKSTPLFLIAPCHQNFIFTLRRVNLRRVFLERNPDAKRESVTEDSRAFRSFKDIRSERDVSWKCDETTLAESPEDGEGHLSWCERQPKKFFNCGRINYSSEAVASARRIVLTSEMTMSFKGIRRQSRLELRTAQENNTQRSNVAATKLFELGFQLAPHPPYSPDLALCNFSLSKSEEMVLHQMKKLSTM
ncbi:hypothetical protein LAZ67_22000525 [Cordylochernes scorpioides]|uniref:Histone-lysine N-methyltransferase SETMAR n=1 Tax=Cordylochernes scorpioides TaxID=51811 RepID=A0ABY6LN97_9ARAC|nr:hypothetical protein LAZ67_22000525 [Cordylochernes scorpioides]